jgi:hypothetical protein
MYGSDKLLNEKPIDPLLVPTSCIDENGNVYLDFATSFNTQMLKEMGKI